jgi:transposase
MALEGGVHVNDTVVAIDIAKAIFELAVSWQPGRVDERKRLTRLQLNAYLSNLPPAVVVMEACGSAHHLAREFQKLGHVVVLLPPYLVRPYVRRNKTDRADAKGLLEAYRNKDIKPVPVKTLDQQMVAALHRARAGWQKERTARLNMLRGICREMGVTIPRGADRVIPEVRAVIGDADSALARPLRVVLSAACDEIKDIEARLALVDKELNALARQLPAVHAWQSVPGIGPVTATALFAFVGDMKRFPTARHFASYIGLTPRERSSGLRRQLGRISKRGDAHLRSLFVQGASSALAAATRSAAPPDRLRTWGLELRTRVGHQKAVVAFANKLARIAWVVAVRNDEFRSVPSATTTAPCPA